MTGGVKLFSCKKRCGSYSGGPGRTISTSKPGEYGETRIAQILVWQLYGGLRRFGGGVAYIICGRAYDASQEKCFKAPLSNEGFMISHNLLESGALAL